MASGPISSWQINGENSGNNDRLYFQFSSVAQSCPTLLPHELQHARPSCPSPTTRVYPNSCPLSQWCHPTISSSVNPSPPAFNLSQYQGLFQRVSSSHQVANLATTACVNLKWPNTSTTIQRVISFSGSMSDPPASLCRCIKIHIRHLWLKTSRLWQGWSWDLERSGDLPKMTVTRNSGMGTEISPLPPEEHLLGGLCFFPS